MEMYPYPMGAESDSISEAFSSLFSTVKVLDEDNRILVYHKANDGAVAVTGQEAALRDALVERLRMAGIEVIDDAEMGQRVLDEANGEARLQAKLDGLKKAAMTIQRWIKNNARGKRFTIELPESTGKLIRKALGRNVDSHLVTANNIAHAKMNHGVGGKKITEKSIALRDEDFELLPYIMTAPTRVEMGSMDASGRESVRFIKEISNGNVLVVEKEQKDSPDDMEAITMWAEKSPSNVADALSDKGKSPAIDARDVIISTEDAAKIRKDAEDAIRNDAKLREHKVNLYYDPRFGISPVRGGWTKAKILKRLKDVVGAKTGYSFAARRIAEFDSADELAEHMFYHGTQYGGGRLKPSILMSDSEIERIGGGGYGEKYWGVSVSKSKRVASNFSSGRTVSVYPVILVKNAKIKEMPELRDAADLEDCIESLWKEGIDAVWIGDKDNGEQELCVLNPAAMVNIDTPDIYQSYKLGTSENPLNTIDSDGINKLYEDAKRYVHALENKPQKPEKPSRFLPSEDGGAIGKLKDEEVYQQELSEYETKLDEYNNSEEARRFIDEDEYARRNIRFFRTADGHAYGFTVGGRVYIDPRIATAETPIHEYSHLWATAFRRVNPKEWGNIVGLMKGSGLWDEVKTMYPELKSDDEIADEVLAQFSGRRGAERLRRAQEEALASEDGVLGKAAAVSGIARVKEALRRFWKGVADWLGIRFGSAEEVADKVLADLLNGVNPAKVAKDGRVRLAPNAEEADIVARAKADGTYMLAPNGKPSRLSPRQWVQVRTLAFKRWFGDWLLPHMVLKVVVADKSHGFRNFDEARAWAKAHIVRTLSDKDTGGKGDIRISGTAVSKFLSESAVLKSDSKDVHLAVLKVLPEVIRESVDAEQHPDFKKGEDGKRSPKNGVNEYVTIHRLYGAVDIDGKLYRVKITLKEYADSNRPQKAYSYEATKIELLAGTLVGGQASNPSTNNSISAANLLKDVESSYGDGKKLLDCSKVVDENGEPLVVYHGSGSKRIKVFNAENGMTWVSSMKGYAESAFGKDGKTYVLFADLRNPLYVGNVGLPLDVSRFCDMTGLPVNDVLPIINSTGAKMVYELTNSKDFRDLAYGLGYDGFEAIEAGGKAYALFNPTQIKSATGNVGTFSGRNADIRYQFVGEKGAEGAFEDKEGVSRYLSSFASRHGLSGTAMTQAIGGREELEALRGRLEDRAFRAVQEEWEKKGVFGCYLPRLGMSFVFTGKFGHDAETAESVWWHEQTHHFTQTLSPSELERVGGACLDYLRRKRPEIYDGITSHYLQSEWADEACAHVIEDKIDEFGTERFMNARFVGDGIVANFARQIQEYFKNEKEGRRTSGDRLRATENEKKEDSSVHGLGVQGGRNGELEERAGVSGQVGQGTRGSETAAGGEGLTDPALYRLREDAPPRKTGVGYKVFVLKDGKLYPPMVANPGGEATPVGVWLDADAAPVAGLSKTGRQQVKAGGKGTQGGSGKLAYRPGWHLGEIPYALQFNRVNPETGEKELFPANFPLKKNLFLYLAGVESRGFYIHLCGPRWSMRMMWTTRRRR